MNGQMQKSIYNIYVERVIYKKNWRVPKSFKCSSERCSVPRLNGTSELTYLFSWCRN